MQRWLKLKKEKKMYNKYIYKLNPISKSVWSNMDKEIEYKVIDNVLYPQDIECEITTEGLELLNITLDFINLQLK